MVSIVPNQYQIEGTILSVRKDVEPDRFALLTIEVDKKKWLKGPEEWLKDIDDPFQAYLQEESLKEHHLKKGMHLRCVVRRTPGRFFILPDSVRGEEMRDER